MINVTVPDRHCLHINTGKDVESGDEFCRNCKVMLKKGDRDNDESIYLNSHYYLGDLILTQGA
jgi:predicted nucleic acid-binding Zn ribbon protein